jgi:hypothetical protein
MPTGEAIAHYIATVSADAAPFRASLGRAEADWKRFGGHLARPGVSGRFR